MPSTDYNLLKERATPEVIMLVGILVVSTYMLIESFTFSYEVGLFPRFAAIITLSGTLLLLSKNYLPEPVRNVIDDSASIFDYEEGDFVDSDVKDVPEQDKDDTQTVEDTESSEPNLETVREAQRNQATLAALLLGYGVVGYTIGLILATPLFVIAYSLVFNIQKWIGALLLAIAMVIAFAFNHILPVDLTQGGVF
jgi:hypothetical protein